MEYNRKLGIIALFVLSLTNLSCEKDNIEKSEENSIEYKIFTDSRDNTSYKTIVIGGQEWMAENFRYKPTNGNYWAYDNDESNVEIYGYMYDWETAVNICPNGWRLPSKSDWEILINYLGGKVIAGEKLKEAGTNHWIEPDLGATNESGFTALPGGRRYISGEYSEITKYGLWWSSTEYVGPGFVHKNVMLLWNNDNDAMISWMSESEAISIRYIKN